MRQLCLSALLYLSAVLLHVRVSINNVRALAGNGTLHYVNGEKYEGQWKNNFAHGHGSITFAGGDKYVGDWVDGKKTGVGELFYENGDKFRGNWLNDRANGEGVLEYVNGDIYEGVSVCLSACQSCVQHVFRQLSALV